MHFVLIFVDVHGFLGVLKSIFARCKFQWNTVLSENWHVGPYSLKVNTSSSAGFRR